MALALAGCGGDDVDTPQPGSGHTLSVTKSSGGSVSSTPAGIISCGTSCTAELVAATTVQLTATPETGYQFAGWGGACTGTTSCTVTMDQDRTVSASFTPVAGNTLALSVTVTGNGSVQSEPAGIDCGTTCTANYPTHTSVTLTATPAAGQSLQGWSGACSGQATTCTVTMDAAQSVDVTFVPTPPTSFALAVAVTGSGTIRSAPVGIDCGTACNANFAQSTSVALTATPAQGQVLQAWGGACAGSAPSCTLTMSAAQSVTATFVIDAAPAPAWSTAALLESSNDFNVADNDRLSSSTAVSAIDADGNALVLWEQSDGVPNGSTMKVYSRRYVAGQGWAAAVVVPGVTRGPFDQSYVSGRLLMDANGGATWIRRDQETRRYNPASGWSATTFEPPSGGAGVSDAKMDAAGNIHMLSGYRSVLYSRLDAGATQWTPWADVSQSTLNPESPRLALGSAGSLIAIWSERNPGDTYYSMKANRTVGGTWQTPVRLEEALSNVHDSSPGLASDANGNAIAAWSQGTSVFVSRFNATASAWSSPSEVDAGKVGELFAAPIQVSMAADGRAAIGWYSGGFAFKAMTYDPSSGYSPPAELDSLSSDAFLSIDDDGRALAVYRTNGQWPPTSLIRNVFSRELAWGGTWSTAALIETGAGDVKGGVRCAMNKAGQAVCAWAQDDLPDNAIRNSLWANLRR
ncbi:MAG: hypothetical protein LCH73_01620 [Proteobacteria bacterium]|nr:hypothetical protein [Pseudomonadota bacterium]